LPSRVVPIVVAEGGLKSVLRQAADDGPAHAAAIAASIRFRVNQKSGQGVRANDLEELRGCAGYEIRARPTRRRFRSRFIERFKNRHLLFGSCRGKKGHGGEKLLQPLVNFGNTLPVNLLLVRGKSEKRAIDEIHHTGFAGARRPVARDNAGSDCFHFLAFGGGQKSELLRFGRGRRLVGVFGRPDNRRPVGRGPGGARCRQGARKKLPTIEFGYQGEVQRVRLARLDSLAAGRAMAKNPSDKMLTGIANPNWPDARLR